MRAEIGLSESYNGSFLKKRAVSDLFALFFRLEPKQGFKGSLDIDKNWLPYEMVEWLSIITLKKMMLCTKYM